MLDLRRFLRTDRSTTLFAQRILLGLVMFPHGAQKLLGWFGGYGFTGTMGYFTGTLHIPSPLAFLVIVGESLGALALILGLGTRLTAFGIAAIMLGAAVTHSDQGFFMNWFGAQKGEGFEYHLLALALAIPLIIRGAGSFALDTWILRALGKSPSPELVPSRA